MALMLHNRSSRALVASAEALCQPPNKQLQRSALPQHVRVARAPFHYARASRWPRGRAAAELRR
jgi:hypothetical protein